MIRAVYNSPSENHTFTSAAPENTDATKLQQLTGSIVEIQKEINTYLTARMLAANEPNVKEQDDEEEEMEEEEEPEQSPDLGKQLREADGNQETGLKKQKTN